MEWSKKSATNAYLATLKLRSEHKELCTSRRTAELESNEFIAALAAGMGSKLILEVTHEVSSSTIALAVAARQTGGKLVCILPEQMLDESKKIIEGLDLNEVVEFKTGDPVELLPHYENIDFSLVNCKTDNYTGLLELLDVNPRRSVVVANNLVEGRKGLGGHLKGIENKVRVRSMKHPIGEGMEITMIGKSTDTGKRDRAKGCLHRTEKKCSSTKKADKSKWVVKFDEKSGEEHVFRLPK